MKVVARMTAAAALISVLAGTATGDGTLARSGMWVRTVTGRNTGASNMVTLKTYWEGDRKRTERYTIDGLLVEIKNGRTIYIYNPSAKMAEKIVVPDKHARSVQQELQAMAKMIPKGGKVIGSAKVAGVQCRVYKLSMPGGSKHSVRAYVSTDSRFPMLLKTRVVAGSRSEITDTTALKLNYNVPDSTFSLPKGVKVTVGEFKAMEMPEGHPPTGNPPVKKK